VASVALPADAFFHAREIFQPHDSGGRELPGDFIKALLGGVRHGFALLVEQSWEKQKLRVFNLKSIRAFAQSAFAEDEDLFAAGQSIDDDGPFFERGSHKERVTERRGEGNRNRCQKNAVQKKLPFRIKRIIYKE